MNKPKDFIPIVGVEKEYKKLSSYRFSEEDSKKVVSEMIAQNKKDLAKLGKKALNGKMEDMRLEFLINTPTYYERILKEASSIIGKSVKSIKKLGCRGPADLICIMEDGKEIGIEVKGFTGKKNIDITRPWHNTTPQTANIHNEYAFDTTFINYWYNNVLPVFKREFKMTHDIPEKSVWIKEDMLNIDLNDFQQGT